MTFDFEEGGDSLSEKVPIDVMRFFLYGPKGLEKAEYTASLDATCGTGPSNARKLARSFMNSYLGGEAEDGSEDLRFCFLRNDAGTPKASGFGDTVESWMNGPSQFRRTPDCNESAALHSYGLDSHCR